MAYQKQKPPQQGGPRPMTQNEGISFEEAFKKFVVDLNTYKEQVQAVLPSGISFERFRSVIIMAIRRTPKLIECERTSLINACIHAAHDGLLPDGRDAVILPVWNKEKRVNEASYRSMVAGLIRQIIGSGAATKIQPFVVYQGEEFEIYGGSDARIHHKVEPDGKKRGDVVGVYAMAGLKDGESTFQYMTVDQIEEVRKVAQTQNVWERHWEEMGIKTVIRRLRKRLAGTDKVADMEERIMFPQFAAEPAPALGSRPPRPTRDQFERLEDRSFDKGVPLDWGDDREREKAELNDPRSAERSGKVDVEKGQADASRGDDAKTMDWQRWSDGLLCDIGALATAVDVNSRWAAERPTIQSAPREIANDIDAAFNDRLVALTAGSSSHDTGAGADGKKPEGENA